MLHPNNDAVKWVVGQSILIHPTISCQDIRRFRVRASDEFVPGYLTISCQDWRLKLLEIFKELRFKHLELVAAKHYANELTRTFDVLSADWLRCVCANRSKSSSLQHGMAFDSFV